MSLRLLATPLLVICLFLSTIGCSKKEAAAPALSTGSFQLDGTLTSGHVTATRSAGSIGGTAYDFLTLDLMPTQTGQGVVRLNLLLYKVPGSSDDTFLLNNLLVFTNSNTSAYNFASQGFTLTATGSGRFSGSFAGRVSASSSSIPGPYTTITNGTFTSVQF
ncbi:hypothetical protein [Hymenobacter sp. UYCo722]|uniref:hypothetical protein n=1 Tax=Hymenobacter sp. UYCo722 TaxID=3156335 RepID=UPI0033987AB1